MLLDGARGVTLLERPGCLFAKIGLTKGRPQRAGSTGWPCANGRAYPITWAEDAARINNTSNMAAPPGGETSASLSDCRGLRLCFNIDYRTTRLKPL